KAVDGNDPNITSQRVTFSTQPIIAVTPGDPSRFVMTPAGDIDIGAGSLTNFGSQAVSARLSDDFDNFASSGGLVVTLSVVNVLGTTGTISYNPTASSLSLPVSTDTAVTDAFGRVG